MVWCFQQWLLVMVRCFNGWLVRFLMFQLWWRWLSFDGQAEFRWQVVAGGSGFTRFGGDCWACGFVGERERERERSERWERRERNGCVYSLYYFNEFYVKIKNKMLSEL